jgi:hypothetical protein
MDYISTLKDSIETSVTIKIFNTTEESTHAHIFNSRLIKLPISIFKNIQNFNPNRLQKSAIKAYPLNDRPRGNKNISSVKFYQKQIKEKKNILPIWMAIKNEKYILLDGAHRIVANYIEGKLNIYAYLIEIL